MITIVSVPHPIVILIMLTIVSIHHAIAMFNHQHRDRKDRFDSAPHRRHQLQCSHQRHPSSHFKAQGMYVPGWSLTGGGGNDPEIGAFTRVAGRWR